MWVEILGHVSWPLTLIIVALIFKKPLILFLLVRIKSLNLWGNKLETNDPEKIKEFILPFITKKFTSKLESNQEPEKLALTLKPMLEDVWNTAAFTSAATSYSFPTQAWEADYLPQIHDEELRGQLKTWSTGLREMNMGLTVDIDGKPVAIYAPKKKKDK
jgi:hypothetical protein